MEESLGKLVSLREQGKLQHIGLSEVTVEEIRQEFVLLSIRAVRNIFRSPHYADDIFIQMDVIGVGSLFIVSLIGLFSGIVMALQMARALTQYGAQGQVGSIVAITLVRELGPVLTAVLVAGRNASGIASELGSMKVTEQIDVSATSLLGIKLAIRRRIPDESRLESRRISGEQGRSERNLAPSPGVTY